MSDHSEAFVSFAKPGELASWFRTNHDRDIFAPLFVARRNRLPDVGNKAGIGPIYFESVTDDLQGGGPRDENQNADEQHHRSVSGHCDGRDRLDAGPQLAPKPCKRFPRR